MSDKVQVPDFDIEHFAHLTLWRVRGEEASDSAGGDCIYYVLTDSNTAVPDVHSMIRHTSGGKYAFYNVTEINQIGSLILDDMPDDSTPIVSWIANQSRLQMSDRIADFVGRLILTSSRLSDEDWRSRRIINHLKPAGTTGSYRGVKIIYDDPDNSTSMIFDFLEEMSGRHRKRLISARPTDYGSKIDLEWDGHPPRGYREGDEIHIGQSVLTIGKSVNISA